MANVIAPPSSNTVIDRTVVASVSCIDGLGSADAYKAMMVPLAVKQEVNRNKMLAKFVDIQYERNNIVLERGKFRVCGDCRTHHESRERSNMERPDSHAD
jgi:excinuclease UvrABC helicase subunit UvrB